MVNTKKIQEQLTKNLLLPIVLDLLEDHPMCGYEVMSTIKKTYGVNLGASTMYPTLDKLEGENLVASVWNMDGNRPKKVYKLTGDGLRVLHDSVSSLTRICRSFVYDGRKLERDRQLVVLT